MTANLIQIQYCDTDTYHHDVVLLLYSVYILRNVSFCLTLAACAHTPVY
jgi:hypothetical protein